MLKPKDKTAIEALRFTAEWCEPCKAMDKHWTAFLKANPDLVPIVSDESDDKPTRLGKLYDVQSVPTVIFRRKGSVKALATVNGYATQLTLARGLERALIQAAKEVE